MLLVMAVNTKCPGPHGRDWLRILNTLRKDTLSVLIELTQHYGDFVCTSLGKLPIYVLNHPEMVQWVLQRNYRNYSKDTFQYNLLRKVTGDGLLTSDGELWLNQRRLVQPAFSRNRIGGFSTMMVEVTQSMLEQWEDFAKRGTPIDIYAEMMRLALEIVGKALFSIDLGEKTTDLTQATLEVLEYVVYRARNPFAAPIWIPTSHNRKFQIALRTLDEVVYGLIQRRQQSLAMDNVSIYEEKQFGLRSMNKPQGDLLDMLLNREDGQPLTKIRERLVRDQIVTFLIAGHETVASALTWTLYLLAKHPSIAEPLREQVVSVLGRQEPTSQALEEIPFLRMVFQEGLRLYPPAWLITRKALQEDEVCGYTILPNSLLVISPYTLHRHPVFWNNPEEFKPQRFSPDISKESPRFSYIPFGGGPRLCIGDEFAMLEGQIVLAAILQHFRFTLVRQEVAAEPLVTLLPRGGMWMKLHKTG